MFVGELKPFQQRARDQILEWGRGLLAVTMGGGKTPITISIIEELLEREEVECGLIIVPSSLKYQWNGERGFPMFAPDANVIVIDGTPDQRREQYMRAKHWAEYIVISYSQVVDDWKYVKHLPADYVVMDEAQAIKNPGSDRSQKMEKLLRRARKREAMIIGLTGQPLENRPEDVFHVCAGIDPRALGHFEIFDKTFIKRNKYGKAVRHVNLDLLHRTLEERIMVRVARDEIKSFFPDRTEESWVVPFDDATLAVYTIIVLDLLEALREARVQSNFNLADHYAGRGVSPAQKAQRGRIMSRLTCARMVCDHPDLLRMSADLYKARASGEDTALKTGSAYAHELAERRVLEQLPRGTSPKLRVVRRDVKKILSADPENKVAIFSTFKPTLTWLEQAIPYHSVLFHGGVTPKRREELKQKFNNDRDVRVFLSTDAGGAGVDLRGGSHLINYNLPFSAGQLDQRNARIDRMSSAHANVKMINYMMEGSVEEFYADIVEARQATAAAGIDGKVNRSGSVRLPAKSLREFLEGWLAERVPASLLG